MFRFICSKTFFIHFALAACVLAGLLFFINRELGRVTLHGQTIVVPSLRGMALSGVDTILTVRRLRWEIMDSVYERKVAGGVVISHDPPAGARVKENRKVYLVVNAMHPPDVKVPALIDLSLRQAIEAVEALGFRVGELTYAEDIARNAVIAQRIHGADVPAGTPVPRGTVIDLVLGSGLGGENVPVPDLTGMTAAEAEKALQRASLNLGACIRDETLSDSSDMRLARVWKQTPPPSAGENAAPMGSYVDVWLTGKEFH